MNHTWENGEKPNFGPSFGLLDSILGPQIFFVDFTPTSSWKFLQTFILCNFQEN